MAMAVSNRDVVAARFDVAPFDGPWLASIGRPELHGSWLIYGTSGSGKTTFALMLAKYLSRFRRVAYDTLEQGLSLSFQNAWNRVGMAEAGGAIFALDKETVPELRERLGKRRSPDIVFIDSLTCLPDFTRRTYMNLLADFPRKLFVFLAHERKGIPDPAVADTVLRLSEVKMHMVGYRACITSRYAIPELGEGTEDFIVWEQGDAEYRASQAIKSQLI